MGSNRGQEVVAAYPEDASVKQTPCTRLNKPIKLLLLARLLLRVGFPSVVNPQHVHCAKYNTCKHQCEEIARSYETTPNCSSTAPKKRGHSGLKEPAIVDLFRERDGSLPYREKNSLHDKGTWGERGVRAAAAVADAATTPPAGYTRYDSFLRTQRLVGAALCKKVFVKI